MKFCENGAKAVNWESTGRSVDPDFFAKYSVSALAGQSDYWLEYQGRLTHPMRYDAATDHYVETTWEEAFALVARHLKALKSPDEAEFYTSGRASNEAAFLYQLFVRAFGTNNFPDCSNMCHEASGLGMAETLGWARAPWSSTTWRRPMPSSSSARTPAPTTRACSNRCARPCTAAPR